MNLIMELPEEATATQSAVNPSELMHVAAVADADEDDGDVDDDADVLRAQQQAVSLNLFRPCKS